MPPLDLEAKKRRLTMLGYIIRYNSPVTRELVSDVSDVERGGGKTSHVSGRYHRMGCEVNEPCLSRRRKSAKRGKERKSWICAR